MEGGVASSSFPELLDFFFTPRFLEEYILSLLGSSRSLQNFLRTSKIAYCKLKKVYADFFVKSSWEVH
jgi:hypothetical protein